MHGKVLDQQARSRLLERVFDELVDWRITSRDPEEQERLLERLGSRAPSIEALLQAVRVAASKKEIGDTMPQSGPIPADLIPYLLLMFPVE